MKKYSFKQLLATALVLGVLATSIFPSCAYAEEVGEQIAETSESVYGDLVDKAPLIEQAILDAITARGGDVTDEALLTEVREEILEKIRSGEITLEEPTDESSEESLNELSEGNTEECAEKTEEDNKEQAEVLLNTVLLVSDSVPEDTLGAISVENLTGVIRLTYEDNEKAKIALDTFVSSGYVAEYDTSVDVIEEEAEKTDEVNKEEVNLDEVTVVEEEIEEIVEVENEKQVGVAIIDTGLDITSEVFANRLSRFTDPAMTDENGHGTLMAEIIASQTSENVKILPIKAFDENGKSTVGSVYSAILYAVEHNADVINLSVSGAGTSPMLTKAIAYAKAKGVVVVVSAGNNADDVEGYMPGNIEDAITVSATDENKEFALYSNYGEKIDFAAMGTIIKDMGTEETEDDEIYEGTSIASAYVSSYAAYILDQNENADVEKCLEASADDFGGTVSRTYFGFGFLEKEHLRWDINKDGSVVETDDNTDNESVWDEEDANQEMLVCHTEADLRFFVTNGYNWAGIALNSDIVITDAHVIRAIGDKYIDGQGHKLIYRGGTCIDHGILSTVGTLTIENLEIDAGGAYKSNGYAVVSAEPGGTLNLNNVFIHGGYGPHYDVQASLYNPTQGGSARVNATNVRTTGDFAVWPGSSMNCTDCTTYAGCFVNSGTMTTTNCSAVVQDTVDNAANMWSAHKDAGFYNDGTLNINNGIVHNKTNGILNQSKLTMYSGNIYSNKYGISNTGTVNFISGNVYNNNSTYPGSTQWATGCGIINNGGTFNISGGAIHNNGWGNVWNNIGTLNVSGGTISQTTGQHQTSSYGIWNNGTCNITGGNIYGYTARNNGNEASAVRNCGMLTVKNSPYIHGSRFGIDNSAGTTNIENANIYENTDGIYCHTGSTVNLKNGTIRNNTGYGISSTGTMNISGGSVYSNKIGLYCSAGYTNMTGGTIKDSTQMNVDVYNGTVDFRRGSITGSGAYHYGVQIENIGNSTFNQYANIGTNSYGGVRVVAQGANRYNVYNGATSAVGSNGKDTGVYLEPGASMTIHQPLTQDIKVASYDRYTGKVIANCASEAIAQSAQQHLKLTNNASFQKTTLNTRKYADDYTDLKNAFGYNYEALWNHYNNQGRSEGRSNDDANKTVVYRKGNGETGAKTQVIVSQVEDTTFDENLADNGLTNNKFSARIRTSDTFTGHKNAKWRKTVTTYWGEKNAPRAESIVYYDGKDVSKSVYNTGWSSTRKGAKEYSRILNTYVCWYPTTLYAKYNTGYDPNANHNDIDKPEKDDGTDDILNPNPQNPSDEIINPTPVGQGFTIYFSGNGNTNNIAGFEVQNIPNGYHMPYNNHFIKQYKNQTRYDNKNSCDITFDDNYTFQGWSIDREATYLSTEGQERCMLPEEELDTLRFLDYCVTNKSENVMIKDNAIVITDYVVWDRAPLINATDKYWYMSEINNKTDDELISEILKTVRVNDKEDTNNVFRKVKESGMDVEIVDFDRNILKNLGEVGYATVTCKAKDGAGNSSTRIIKVYVTNANSKNKVLDPTAGPLERSYKTYTRMIDKENYNKTKTVNGKTVPDSENGALQEDSIWYGDINYKNAISQAFSHIDNDTSIVSYEYDVHDITASKHFCRQYGSGNTKTKDGLKRWYQKFIVEDGARVSGTLPIAM